MSRMDHSIILAGQQPNIVNTLANSTRAAAIANQNQHQNALRQTYQQHGPGILSGDQNALNQLAQLDPREAFGIQQTHRQNARQDRADALSEQEFAFRINQFKANASAAEVKAQAEEFKRTVFSASAAKTPEEWDLIVWQAGESELVGQFDNREALLRKYMTAAQILEADAPDKPADEYGRYVAEEEAAGRVPMSRIEFKRAGQKTTRTKVDADGNVSIEEGFGENEAPPKLTVDAAKNTGFYIRTRDANQTLNQFEQEGLRFLQQNLDSLPLGVGNYFADPEFQQFDQARRDFVNSILRRESGAVISDQEFDNANKQYFPVPGDSEEVIAQKRRNRENAIEGLRVGSGEGAGFVERQDKQESRIPDFKAMTDEELDAWIAENGGDQ